MPIDKTTDEDLRNSFETVSKETNQFSCLPPALLSSDPKRVKVFRMLIGASLKEMGKLIGKNFVTVSNYELGKIRTIPLEEAKKISTILLNNLSKPVSEKVLLENLSTFRGKSKGGMFQALRRAETMALTNQESAVRTVLENANVKFKTHVTLPTKVGPFNFDFLVNGNTVIDCTTTKSKWKAESLGFRAIKIKESHPDYKTIAIIPSGINQGFLRRLVDFDAVVRDNEMKVLTALV